MKKIILFLLIFLGFGLNQTYAGDYDITTLPTSNCVALYGDNSGGIGGKNGYFSCFVVDNNYAPRQLRLKIYSYSGVLANNFVLPSINGGEYNGQDIVSLGGGKFIILLKYSYYHYGGMFQNFNHILFFDNGVITDNNNYTAGGVYYYGANNGNNSYATLTTNNNICFSSYGGFANSYCYDLDTGYNSGTTDTSSYTNVFSVSSIINNNEYYYKSLKENKIYLTKISLDGSGYVEQFLFNSSNQTNNILCSGTGSNGLCSNGITFFKSYGDLINYGTGLIYNNSTGNNIGLNGGVIEYQSGSTLLISTGTLDVFSPSYHRNQLFFNENGQYKISYLKLIPGVGYNIFLNDSPNLLMGTYHIYNVNDNICHTGSINTNITTLYKYDGVSQIATGSINDDGVIDTYRYKSNSFSGETIVLINKYEGLNNFYNFITNTNTGYETSTFFNSLDSPFASNPYIYISNSGKGINYIELDGNIIDNSYYLYNCENIDSFFSDSEKLLLNNGLPFNTSIDGKTFAYLPKTYKAVCVGFVKGYFNNTYLYNTYFGYKENKSIDKQICVNQLDGGVTINGEAYGSLTGVTDGSGGLIYDINNINIDLSQSGTTSINGKDFDKCSLSNLLACFTPNISDINFISVSTGTLNPISTSLISKFGLDRFSFLYNVTIPSNPDFNFIAPILYLESDGVHYRTQTGTLTFTKNMLGINHIEESTSGKNFISFILGVLYIITRLIIIGLVFFIFKLVFISTKKLVTNIFGLELTQNSNNGNIITAMFFVAYLLALIGVFVTLWAFILPLFTIINIATNYITLMFTFWIYNFFNFTVFYTLVNSFFIGIFSLFILYTLYLFVNKYLHLS